MTKESDLADQIFLQQLKDKLAGNASAASIFAFTQQYVEALRSQAAKQTVAEARLKDRAAWLAGQQKSFQAAMHGKSLRQSLQPIVDTIIKCSDGEARAAFYHVPPRAKGLHLIAGMTDAYANDVRDFKIGPDSAACGLAMHTGVAVITPDVELEPFWRPFLQMARRHNFRACWSFPVRTDGGPVLGTMAFYYEQPREPTERDLEMAAVLSHAASIIMSRDNELSERAQAEAALRQSEARNRKIIETGAASIIFYDKDCFIIDANEVFLELSGYKRTDIQARQLNWRSITPPEWVEATLRQLVVLKQTGQTGPFEREYLFADGARCWMLSAARDLGDGTFVVFAIDIDPRKQAEARVRELELQYRTQLETAVADRTAELQENQLLLQNIIDSSVSTIQLFKAVRNQQGEITNFNLLLVNKNFVNKYGNLAGSNLLNEHQIAINTGIFEDMARVTNTGNAMLKERQIKQDKFNGWIHQVLVKTDDGVIITTDDISARKSAEAERNKNYVLLQQSEEMALLGSWDFDIKTGLLTWSDGMYRLFNIPAGTAVMPEIYLNYATGAFIDQAAGIVQCLRTGQSDFDEVIEINVNNAVKVLHLKASVLRAAEGEPIRVLGVNMDITALRNAEAKLRQMQAEQQLEVFRASLDTLEEERSRISESLHNGIGQILYGTRISLAGLTKDLSDKEFASVKRYTSKLLTDAIIETRRVSHELMPATLDEFGLKSAIDDICEQMSDGTQFSCAISGLLGRMEKYLELAVYRTTQELMTNVVKHAKATLADVNITVSPTFVSLVVSDNGQGMEASRKGKPGIGLTSIRSKIKLLNGDMQIESSVDAGTKVAVIIPRPKK